MALAPSLGGPTARAARACPAPVEAARLVPEHHSKAPVVLRGEVGVDEGLEGRLPTDQRGVHAVFGGRRLVVSWGSSSDKMRLERPKPRTQRVGWVVLFICHDVDSPRNSSHG